MGAGLMRDMYWGCLLIFIPQNMNRADLNLVLYNPRKDDLRKEKNGLNSLSL